MIGIYIVTSHKQDTISFASIFSYRVTKLGSNKQGCQTGERYGGNEESDFDIYTKTGHLGRCDNSSWLVYHIDLISYSGQFLEK